jgi:hypothetical protein
MYLDDDIRVLFARLFLQTNKTKGRSMNNKIEALLQILAAIAIIYFGQQLLAQGRQNLLS